MIFPKKKKGHQSPPQTTTQRNEMLVPFVPVALPLAASHRRRASAGGQSTVGT
jgi:hypothetical protein